MNISLSVDASKSEVLKNRLIEIAKQLLTDYEEDIESGIEDGTYKAAENVEVRAFIKDATEVIADFEKETIEVLVYVSGGQIQGASATLPLSFKVFDKDNFDGCETAEQKKEFIETFGTPDEWDSMIKDRTEKKELISVF
jgi:hypothetical protein